MLCIRACCRVARNVLHKRYVFLRMVFILRRGALSMGSGAPLFDPRILLFILDRDFFS